MRILICFAIGVLAAACSAGAPDAARPDYARIDRDAKALCAAALPLAPLAGPYAPIIEGACIGEAAIARLASDPVAMARLHEIIKKIPRRA
jgi:hypothetical protein